MQQVPHVGRVKHQLVEGVEEEAVGEMHELCLTPVVGHEVCIASHTLLHLGSFGHHGSPRGTGCKGEESASSKSHSEGRIAVVVEVQDTSGHYGPDNGSCCRAVHCQWMCWLFVPHPKEAEQALEAAGVDKSDDYGLSLHIFHTSCRLWVHEQEELIEVGVGVGVKGREEQA